MILIYLIAMTMFFFSSYGEMKNSKQDLGFQSPNSQVTLITAILAGPISTIGMLILIVVGFVQFPFWIPIAGFIGSGFFAGLIYGLVRSSRMPYLNSLAVLTSPLVGIVATCVVTVG